MSTIHLTQRRVILKDTCKEGPRGVGQSQRVGDTQGLTRWLEASQCSLSLSQCLNGFL